jgi:hypothetical protein
VFLVDTNVLIDVATLNPAWFTWSSRALADAMRLGDVGIDPIVYAEMAAAYDTVEALDDALRSLGVSRLALPFEAGFLASRAFLAHRKAGGARTAPLPDFFIGAHAAVAGLALVTRDPRRIRRYFPRVELVTPA